MRRRSAALVAVVWAAATLGACESCLSQRPAPAGAAAPLPYPDCDAPTAGPPADPAGPPLAEGVLRAGPTMRERRIVERFSIVRRDCHVVGTSRFETPLGWTDVEIVWDDGLRPLRVWTRRSVPGRPERYAVELVELRGDVPRLVRRTALGRLEHRVLRGERPEAVIPPARGLLSAWIQAAGLAVGEKVRQPALDVTRYARIRDVTLRRADDRVEPTLDGSVQVYTVYGRDAVFTDARGVVIGDLAGLRPAATVPEPLPPPLASPSPPDPRAPL